jgi:lipopolysaccharide/colanic/teichoic acid biosynthesis glycosyltransferase
MSLQSLNDLVIRSVHRVQSRDLRKLLPREFLQYALEKERGRSDRSGFQFYWVLFCLERAQLNPRMLRRLGDIIATRTRNTDEVGWFDDTAICSIPYETDKAGVQCLVADILRLAREQDLHPKAVVYSYPVAPNVTDDSPAERPVALIFGDPNPRTRRKPTGQRETLDTTSANQRQSEMFAMKQRFLVRMPWWKRLADIVGASTGLLLFFPLFLAAAFAVKISSHGPILFIQRRAGLGGSPFSMYKFRTMHIDADALKAKLRQLNERDGPAFKIKNDPRLTPVGSFLRSFSIDELPQLFNVLKGDMSLVGPRPPTFEEISEYRSWYMRRLDVTPGLTCIWQVRGRAEVTFESWMRMDMQYIRNYGFWQDFRLLLATVPAVLLRRGAH